MSKHNAKTKYLPFDATEIENSLLKQLQDEIGETEESRTLCLNQLRKNLQELKDVDPCLEDDFLLTFLRVSKFDCSKAFERIKRLYIFQDSILFKIEKSAISISTVQSMPYYFAVPYRMENCSALIIAKMGNIDYSKITFDERTYLDVITSVHLISNTITQMCGVTVIFDYSGFKMRSLLAFRLSSIIQYIDGMQNVFPVRIKAFHVVNAPSLYCTFHTIILPFFSKKIRNRIFVHPKNDNWENLHRCIPPEILPVEYGGYLKQSDVINLQENIEAPEETFRSMLKYGCVKTKDRRGLMKIFV